MHSHGGVVSVDAILLLFAGIAMLAYVAGALAERRRGRPWPWSRVILWSSGVLLAAGSIAGPFAAAAHRDFVAHTWAHLVGGMLAPVLLVLAAPVTLALRRLSVTPARRVSRMLRSMPARVLLHPVPAGIVSAGGLWVVSSASVLQWMRADPVAHLVVQSHLLIAGYVFTAAVIGIDPRPHRPRRVLIAVVLVVSAASHAVLAKVLFANPPASVPPAELRAGAQLMYTGGAWIEALVIVVFCAQWYRAGAPRRTALDPRPRDVRERASSTRIRPRPSE